MKSFVALLISLMSFSAVASPGDLVAITHLNDTPAEQVAPVRAKFCPDEVSLKKAYGFKRYKIDFKTMSVQGEEVTSSGLLILPDMPAAEAKVRLPTFVYQHGTVTARAELPSSNPTFAEGDAIGYCFTSLGYISVLADYLGYGDGTGVHPYLHAKSEAWVARDLMRAAKKATHDMKIPQNRKLFIAGYSQGGHAAMSLVKFLEEDIQSEYVVTAAAPMAGPYALSQMMSTVINNPTIDSPTEGAFILVGLNPIYSLYRNPSQVFQPQVADFVESLFDGSHGFAEVVGKLGGSLNAVFTEKAMKDMVDSDSYLVNSLKLNDLYQWRPRTKMHLYHAQSDSEVPFINSQMAYDYMKKRHAKVELINLGEGLTHQQAFPFAIGKAAVWFESLR